MIQKLFLLAWVYGLSLIAYCQQPPGTEIYLFDFSVKKEKVSLRNPKNITNRAGYDNQPHFHPDKPLIYYSSAMADGRTDIMEYNYQQKQTRNLTTTPEREYSPTVTPDKKYLSCIIQRDNGAQDLGRYPIDGGSPEVIIDNLVVGYHAWINESGLLLFVLGDTLTLHRYNIATKKDEVLAKQIGRSLHRIPHENAMSFVHKVSEGEWLIKKITADGSLSTLTKTLAGREDLAWTPDGKILMSDGKDLFYFWPGKSESWQKISLPAGFTGTISRLAINNQGNQLALVVNE
jgi:hypothetical protein